MSELSRKRAKKWYYDNLDKAKKTHQEYYIKNRIELQRKMKDYAQKNPSINKKAVIKWRRTHPDKDPKKYRVSGKLREKCIRLWKDFCPICNRRFTKTGYLKRIFHHIQYEPVEYVTILCSQCHNLIHSRKCYGHPFIKLGKEESPECMAISILELQNKYMEIHRLLPRIRGGNRKKESKVTLVEKEI